MARKRPIRDFANAGEAAANWISELASDLDGGRSIEFSFNLKNLLAGDWGSVGIRLSPLAEETDPHSTAPNMND